MSDELQPEGRRQLEYVDRALAASVRSELDRDENVLVKVKPESDAIALTLLPFPVLWLTGMFLYSVGTMQTTIDPSQALNGSILLLVLVALLGMVEIIAVPQQAKRTMFVATDRRVFLLKLKGKFGDAESDDYSNVSRKKVRSQRNTMFFYLACTVPIQIIFCLLILDVVRSLASHSSLFTLGGFVTILAALVYHWYQDLRYPIPSLREFPRTFYIINEYLATVESATYEEIDKAVLHKHPSGLGDIFLVAAKKGCLRLKCLPEAQEFYDKIEEQRRIARALPPQIKTVVEGARGDTDKTIADKQIEKFVEEVERLVENQKNEPAVTKESTQDNQSKEAKESTENNQSIEEKEKDL